MAGRITISDIAKEVGVSTTTISRYLNGHFSYMSSETCQKIKETISRLEYIPDSRAKGLKAKNSSLIGVVVSHFNHHLTTQFLGGINEVCAKNGFITISFGNDDDIHREVEQINICRSYHVDALALIPSNVDCEYYQRVRENGTPVVLCSYSRPDWKYDGVFIDNVSLIKQALTRVYQNGYDCIAYMGEDVSKQINIGDRKQAFIELVTEQLGLDGNKLYYTTGRDPQKITEAIAEIRQQYPHKRKCFFAGTTEILHTLLKVIKAQGLRIPEDVAVLGYDLAGWTDVMEPGITTLWQPAYQMGMIAGQKLIQRVRDEHTGDAQVWLEGEIYFRESTRPL